LEAININLALPFRSDLTVCLYPKMAFPDFITSLRRLFTESCDFFYARSKGRGRNTKSSENPVDMQIKKSKSVPRENGRRSTAGPSPHGRSFPKCLTPEIWVKEHSTSHYVTGPTAGNDCARSNNSQPACTQTSKDAEGDEERRMTTISGGQQDLMPPPVSSTYRFFRNHLDSVLLLFTSIQICWKDG
jgi:hypothetical protein